VTAIGDEFLTVAEIAEILKLNQQTVRNWIDQGTLPAAPRRPARAGAPLGLRSAAGAWADGATR
jgi:Helix-turn-helix domain